MKTLSISLLLISFFVSGCNKPGNETHFFKAKVVQTSDVSCHLPVLSFSEDSPGIRSLTKRNDIVYTVIKLPANFNIQDKKLYVSITTLSPEEEFPCNTLGINYPHLKIADVKDRQ